MVLLPHPSFRLRVCVCLGLLACARRACCFLRAVSIFASLVVRVVLVRASMHAVVHVCCPRSLSHLGCARSVPLGVRFCVLGVCVHVFLSELCVRFSSSSRARRATCSLYPS